MGKLTLIVVEGRCLIVKDVGGTSDPYCKIECGGQVFKTKIIPRNLNPRWDERFSVFIRDPRTEKIKITVFDSDMIGTDEQMGSCTLSLDNLVQGIPFDNWFKLTGVNSGELHIILTAEDFSSAPQQSAYGYPPQQSAYGYPPPQQPGYGYPPSQQSAYGYPPPQQSAYGYPTPQQPGYPSQQSAYGYSPQQGYTPQAGPVYPVPTQTYPSAAPSIQPVMVTFTSSSGKDKSKKKSDSDSSSSSSSDDEKGEHKPHKEHKHNHKHKPKVKLDDVLKVTADVAHASSHVAYTGSNASRTIHEVGNIVHGVSKLFGK